MTCSRAFCDFWIQILTNAGRYVTAPPLTAGRQVLSTVAVMEIRTLLLS